MIDNINQNKIHILDVRVDNISKLTALSTVQDFIEHRHEKNAKKIFFTNVHTIHIARKNLKFKKIVDDADLVLADGSGLKIASTIFSNPIKENLNGTDFTPIILKLAELNKWRIFFLGSKENILKACLSKIEHDFPQLEIGGYHSGYFSKEETPLLLKEINESAPDILLVGMGSPIQETFINNYSNELNVAVCFAVGGLFDFLSGYKKRAPLLIRKVGLEWIFRFFSDPKTKWDRIFIEIPVFLILVFLARLFPNTFYPKIERKPIY